MTRRTYQQAQCACGRVFLDARFPLPPLRVRGNGVVEFRSSFVLLSVAFLGFPGRGSCPAHLSPESAPGYYWHSTAATTFLTTVLQCRPRLLNPLRNRIHIIRAFLVLLISRRLNRTWDGRPSETKKLKFMAVPKLALWLQIRSSRRCPSHHHHHHHRCPRLHHRGSRQAADLQVCLSLLASGSVPVCAVWHPPGSMKTHHRQTHRHLKSQMPF